MASAPQVVSVATTLGSADAARLLARRIIEERLGACVQIDPAVLSVYRWEGRLCEETEVRLVVKTIPERIGDLEALFEREHPYELPQFLVTSAEASAAYAAWVRSEATPWGAPPGAAKSAITKAAPARTRAR